MKQLEEACKKQENVIQQMERSLAAMRNKGRTKGRLLAMRYHIHVINNRNILIKLCKFIKLAYYHRNTLIGC